MRVAKDFWCFSKRTRNSLAYIFAHSSVAQFLHTIAGKFKGKKNICDDEDRGFFPWIKGNFGLIHCLSNFGKKL
tara:strand:- start:287 stop:508 length:222 start_codon:yes stop_codon:yes gene_type:complete